MKATIDKFYSLLVRLASSLQSPFLLAIRLYWGYQFAQTGWGKLHNLERVTGFFSSLGVPAPGIMAPFIATLEFAGGIMLALGLFSRVIALLETGNMISAFYLGDHDALFSAFSDPDKFYAAAPYTYLFASLIVLIFGPGKWALDALWRKHDL